MTEPTAPRRRRPAQLDAERAHGIRSALLRYRIMAYVVGVLLVILTLVAMPVKYMRHDDRLVMWTGIPHGWLYMVLLITAVDLGRRVKWSWGRLLLIALAGTIPFLSFVAEHYARKNVHQYLEAHGAPIHAPK